MRNTTKLKNILLKYDIDFSMDDDFHFKMVITDKVNGRQQMFDGKSYGAVLAKAYSYMLKELKFKTGYPTQ